MLTHLKVENFALIKELEIDFSAGFTAITGETGAGKSIILGALSLILGQRADSQSLMMPDKKCSIEGTFKIEGYDLEPFFEANDLDFDKQSIIRREITPQGKSRAFINDTPVNLTIVKELGERLINIHSQHETLTLGDSGFQLAIVDAVAGNQKLREAYKVLFDGHQAMKKTLASLLEKEKQSKADQDYYKFQLDELLSVNLKEGEKEALESELEILNNAGQIMNGLARSSALLSENDVNIIDTLTEINSIFSGLAAFKGEFEEIKQRVESNLIDLKDLAQHVVRLTDHVIVDPEQLELVSRRLDLIYHLEQKHRLSGSASLLLLQGELMYKLDQISSLEDEIVSVSKEIDNLYKTLIEKSKELSDSRIAVLPRISEEVRNTLTSLGMPSAVFKIRCDKNVEPTNDGIDKIIFLFSANKGVEPGEIGKIASGGELSRVMLAIKSLVSQRKLLPTLIFDEIDTGVSGDIAGKVGVIMQKMANNLQLIAITHLPQIAGMSDNQYLVYKIQDDGATYTSIKKLNNQERILEIAKMLSNEKVTEAALATAKELLSNN
ncbi:MAG: DNA repair protein RecN [Bacteroidetes bacterium]|nr:DNA repair protein RecN [Bacteroidota bacterium]